MERRCINCAHARQVGDKSRKDWVGCAKLSLNISGDEDFDIGLKEQIIADSWWYSAHYPGEYNENRRGMMYKAFATKANNSCNKYEER